MGGELLKISVSLVFFPAFFNKLYFCSAGRRSDNGWRTVYYKGRKLDEYREEYKEENNANTTVRSRGGATGVYSSPPRVSPEERAPVQAYPYGLPPQGSPPVPESILLPSGERVEVPPRLFEAPTRAPLGVCTEADFLTDLVRFLWTRGAAGVAAANTVATGRVRLNLKPLDFFGLYRAVVTRGGCPRKPPECGGRRSSQNRIFTGFLTTFFNKLYFRAAGSSRILRRFTWDGTIFPCLNNYTMNMEGLSVSAMLTHHYRTVLLEYERAHPEDISRAGEQQGKGDTDHMLWVQCDLSSCKKWRALPGTTDPRSLPQKWFCSLHPEADFHDHLAPQGER